MIKNLIKSLLLLSLCACFESDDSASGVLKSFIKKTTKSLSQGAYSDYADGQLLESINAMSKDEFKQYQEQSNVDNIRIEILSESCKEVTCTITYITKYRSKTSDGSMYNSEVRKIAELSKSQDGWKVSTIKNVKTYLEAKEGLNALEE